MPRRHWNKFVKAESSARDKSYLSVERAKQYELDRGHTVYVGLSHGGQGVPMWLKPEDAEEFALAILTELENQKREYLGP
jgi:hypothetical protein